MGIQVLNTLVEIVRFADTMMDSEKEVMLAGRRVRVSIHGRFHSPFEYVYDGTAVDLASGKIIKAKHWKSRKGATEHTLIDMYQALQKAGLIAA